MSSIFGSISARTSLTSRRDYKLTIQLLDDNENIVQEFNKNATGQTVLDYVCEYLNIVEKDSFGLRFQDINKHRYWIDLNKPISKQLKGSNLGLRFRVRFYPSNVGVLQEELTRYQLFVQLQRDLLHGRLYCPQNEGAILGGLILQSLLGDYDQEERSADYVSEYKLLLKQTANLEEKIAEAHKSFRGLTPAEAEMEFLQRASKLDTYGFDPYTVTDKQGQMVYVGVTHRGIFVYQTNRMVHHISWDQLDNVNFLGKELIITPVSTYISPYVAATSGLSNGHAASTLQKAAALKYKCPSGTFAKHLWRHILSQQAFFTESEAKRIKTKFSKPRIPLLSRGSSFRFPNSRVLHEIEMQKPFVRNGPLPQFVRYPLPRQEPRRLVREYQTLPPMHFNETFNSTIPENEPIMEKTEVWEPALEADEDKLEEEEKTSTSVVPEAPKNISTEHVDEKPEETVNEGQNVDESVVLNSGVEPVPLCASTPIREDFSSNEIIHEEVELRGAEDVAGLLNNSPVINEMTLSSQENANDICNTRKPNNFAKSLFFCLLIILLVSAFAVVLFESDTKLVSLPLIEEFRHNVYDPLRDYVTSRFINNYL